MELQDCNRITNDPLIRAFLILKKWMESSMIQDLWSRSENFKRIVCYLSCQRFFKKYQNQKHEWKILLNHYSSISFRIIFSDCCHFSSIGFCLKHLEDWLREPFLVLNVFLTNLYAASVSKIFFSRPVLKVEVSWFSTDIIFVLL